MVAHKKGKGKGAELVFDDKARAEYLTGFRKRKQERKQAGRDYLAKKAKEEQLAARKELREARKEKAAENVREQRKAYGLEAEGESDLDQAAVGSDDEDVDDDDEDAVPQIQEEEYDSDEHHTHVVVESFDPEQEAFEKATASAAAPTAARKSNAKGVATSSVEALPPSSRRVNKAKANASLSSPSLPLPPLLSPLSSIQAVLTLASWCSFLLNLRCTGQGQETSDAHQEKDVAQQRLHISGLTESFSKEELERRFSTFGIVVAIDGLGKRDALGQFRPYAYLTIEAEPAQIKRCINLLSGSVWKGATLRIGEAKPDYQERIRLEKEKRKEQEAEELERKARKQKRMPPGMGVESRNMDPVDEQAVENDMAWGWKRTPAGHLVRPLRMRPAHPLPRPSRASTLARADVAADQVEEEEAQPKRSARVNPRPPTKAHRITIDPTRYGAIHLSGALLESLAAETDSSSDTLDLSSLGPGEWQCVEIEDGEQQDETHRLVRWQFVAKDGKVLHQEFAKIPVRVVAASAVAEIAGGGEADDVMAQLDFDRYSDAGSDDLFSGFTSALTPTPAKPKQPKLAAAPAALAVEAVDTADIDDLFSGRATAGVSDLFSDLPSAPCAAAHNDLFSDLPSMTTPASENAAKRIKVDSAIAASANKVKGTFVPGLDPEEEAPGNFSDGYDENAAAAGPTQGSRPIGNADEERKKTLALLGEMFGSGSDDEAPPAAAVDVVESEEDEQEEQDRRSDSSSSSETVDQQDEADETWSEESSEEDEEDAEASVEQEPVPAAHVEMQEAAPASPAAEQPLTAPMDAKSRRAAFLLSLSDPSAASKNGSYVPIARFDPGPQPASTTPAAAPSQAEPAPDAAIPNNSATPAAASEPVGTQVSMSTLKEMFKPQDRASTSGVTAGFSLGLGADAAKSGAGFSLMDSLGLEFELEEELDQPEPEPTTTALFAPWLPAVGYSRYPASTPAEASTEAPQRKFDPFFSSRTNPAAWNGANAQGALHRWLQPRSEQQKEEDWTKYKQELTKVIKKRHREAARKHKRNFKSLPTTHKNPPVSKA